MSDIDVLVVEDDIAVKKALPVLLSSKGFSVKFVDTLSDALEAVKLNPKFLLLDLQLSDGNGIEVLKYIKENNLSTKCAITTSYLDSNSKAISSDCKCSVLMKPIELKELLRFLDNENEIVEK